MYYTIGFSLKLYLVKLSYDTLFNKNKIANEKKVILVNGKLLSSTYK
jgi:hypothetical protein